MAMHVIQLQFPPSTRAERRWARALWLLMPAPFSAHDGRVIHPAVPSRAPWYVLVSTDQNGGGVVRTWQLQEAKARFSELVREAEGGQAQVVSKHGVPSVVVVDVATFERLMAPGRSLVDALLAAPRFEQGELDLERDPSPPRPSDLS
jgi:prevent-host-death family protein